MIDLQVIFEDEHLLAITKPAGLVVNYSHTAKGDTVQSWLVARLGGEKNLQSLIQSDTDWQQLVPADFSHQYGTPQEIFLQRQGLVHRLDKDTSGILLLAKNPGSLVNLLLQFKQRTVQKKYLCLVHGKPKVDSAVIRAPLTRSMTDRHKYRVEIEGRPAATNYRVIEHYSQLDLEQLKEKNREVSAKLKKELKSYQQGFSLLECLPETGRTHQIRVHLAHINHPLVADATYAGGKRGKLDKLWCPRHFLHAGAIAFTHPASNEKLVLKAELSEDLAEVLKLLK